jgi:hypothetical protein
MKRVVIINADASPVQLEFSVSENVLQAVLNWYFGFHSGDTITVQIDGIYVETNADGDITK